MWWTLFLPSALLSSALQHSALLQCLAQCTEVTPYLLVMEFCPMVRRPSHWSSVGEGAYDRNKQDHKPQQWTWSLADKSETAFTHSETCMQMLTAVKWFVNQLKITLTIIWIHRCRSSSGFQYVHTDNKSDRQDWTRQLTVLPSSGQRLLNTDVPSSSSSVSRGMWRVTSEAAGLWKPWQQSRWFFSGWPVTSPLDCCICTDTTSHTGRFCHWGETY